VQILTEPAGFCEVSVDIEVIYRAAETLSGSCVRAAIPRVSRYKKVAAPFSQENGNRSLLCATFSHWRLAWPYQQAECLLWVEADIQGAPRVAAQANGSERLWVGRTSMLVSLSPEEFCKQDDQEYGDGEQYHRPLER
jgi:hypothetical protein